MKQIFPKEIVESTIEVHQFKHKNKSKIIYGIITISVIVALLSLPFIYITVYNNSQGIVKPDKERVLIQNSMSGKVQYQNLVNNRGVKKGDTLLVIQNSSIQQKIQNVLYQIKETENFVKDLTELLNAKKQKKELESLKFTQEYIAYKQQQQELQTRYRKLKKDYVRSKNLFSKGVIARVELNNTKFNFDLALNAIAQLKKQQQNTWQTQLVSYNNKLQELKATKVQLEENSTLSIIKAPITGTLLNVKGIEKGSFIGVGMQVAEISPKTDLLIECYVTPTNIGLLKEKDTVNFQVAAFNYNQWGLATGSIIEIANDVQIINNTPVFKVLCSLDQKYLQLKNGFKGHLKKGMTVNARFTLTKRTLFDLLYDKMDDWLNPSSQKIASSTR